MISTPSEELFKHIRQSQPLTRLILLGILAYLSSSPVIQWGISQNNAQIVLGWLGFTLLLEIVLAASTLLLMRQGQETSQMKPLAWMGAILIIAGIWSDVLATVFHSPDMAQEGNPIIIFLRDNGFPLSIQYLTGFTAQFLLTVISCALWIAFVRHLPLYKAILLVMRPQSLVEFVWASLGGRTYFSKTERLRVSRSYRLMWWLILPLIMPFNRFMLALEWMGVIQPASFATQSVEFLQTIFPIVLLLSWLIYVYFEKRDSLRTDPVFTRRANQANIREALIRLSVLMMATCALVCVSSIAYFWATREPDYLDVRLEDAPETIPVNMPFPVTFVIQNLGAKEAVVSKIQTTAWESNGKVVSEKLLFVLATTPAIVNTDGPQTTFEYENISLAPNEALRVELWFAGVQPGDVLLKTSIYSGWQEKTAPSVFIQITPPNP